MLRAALEATSICKPVHTGIQKYIVELLDAIAHACDDTPGIQLTALYKLSHREHADRRINAPAIRNRWYFGNGVPVMGRFDVVHALDMRAPIAFGSKLITTVYDLAVFHEEHQFDAFSKPRFRQRKRAGYERLFAKSAALIAISESTKRDIVERFGYPAGKIHVIYPGLTPRFIAEPDERFAKLVMRRYHLKPKTYFLFVGPPNERKNADRVIDGFMKSNSSKNAYLVFTGNPAYMDDAIRLRLENKTIAKKVRFIGYAKDEELPALYANARAFVFPTLYEGFGLPIVEALACGIPAVIGNRGAAQEAGGEFAIQVDPFSIDAIAQGIDGAASQKKFPAESARAWARSFDWDRAAKQHLDVYRRIAGGTD